MTDERLKTLLTGALPRADADGPAHDLWPAVASRCEATPRWSYLDLSLAAAVILVLVMFPEWIWLLVYHM